MEDFAFMWLARACIHSHSLFTRARNFKFWIWIFRNNVFKHFPWWRQSEFLFLIFNSIYNIPFSTLQRDAAQEISLFLPSEARVIKQNIRKRTFFFCAVLRLPYCTTATLPHSLTPRLQHSTSLHFHMSRLNPAPYETFILLPYHTSARKLCVNWHVIFNHAMWWPNLKQ